MNADFGIKDRGNNPGTRQVLTFFLIAVSIGIPALWIGGSIVGYFAFLLFGLLFVAFFSGNKRRLLLVAYLVLAVGLLVGGVVYARLSDEATAAKLEDLPLVGSLLAHRIAKFGVAALTGLIGGFLAVGLPLFLIIFVSAEWMLALRETHDLDRKLAIKLMLTLTLGVGKAYIIVEDGEIVYSKPKGPLDLFGAPTVVVIKPYNAVVMERSGKVTQIEGPGLVTMRKHERIRGVFDLQIQGQNFDMEALTKDNVPLKVSGNVIFRIESWQEARERGDKGDFETRDISGIISGSYPVYRRTLHRAAYGTRSDLDWKSQTLGITMGQVGAAIRNYRLDEIFVLNENERVGTERSVTLDIVDQAMPRIAEIVRYWGVRVGSINIVSIEMPEEAQKEFLSRWEEPWKGWRQVHRAEIDLDVAELEARASMVKERAKSEHSFKEDIRRARAFEEHLRTIVREILDIQDNRTRAWVVVEVMRSLQPVDKRFLRMFFDKEKLPGRLFGGAGLLDAGGEEPPQEE